MRPHQKRVLIALGWYDYRLHRGIEKFAQEHHWHISANSTREKTIPWGWDGDGEDGDLYQVYQIRNGSVVDQTPPPNLSGFNQAIARRKHAGQNRMFQLVDDFFLDRAASDAQIEFSCHAGFIWESDGDRHIRPTESTGRIPSAEKNPN